MKKYMIYVDECVYKEDPYSPHCPYENHFCEKVRGFETRGEAWEEAVRRASEVFMKLTVSVGADSTHIDADHALYSIRVYCDDVLFGTTTTFDIVVDK